VCHPPPDGVPVTKLSGAQFGVAEGPGEVQAQQRLVPLPIMLVAAEHRHAHRDVRRGGGFADLRHAELAPDAPDVLMQLREREAVYKARLASELPPPQPAQRLPHVGGGGASEYLETVGGVAAQVARYGGLICSRITRGRRSSDPREHAPHRYS
jgi:hypothetical protein